MKRIFYILGLVTTFSFLSFAEGFSQEEAKKLEVTVYNQNLALVKDKRFIQFKKGENQISLEEVASLIDPTSVHFKVTSNPQAYSIREQNYEYDLLGGETLLQKYIGQKLRLQTKDGKAYEGVLLSFDRKQIILGANKDNGPLNLIQREDNIQTIIFPAFPEGLITRPTLNWEIHSKKSGQELVELSYLTTGISWQADYVATVNENDTKLDLSGWVTITNQSGGTYKEAKLKLVAGDIHLASREARALLKEPRMVGAMAEEGFRERPFFEYHLYSRLY